MFRVNKIVVHKILYAQHEWRYPGTSLEPVNMLEELKRVSVLFSHVADAVRVAGLTWESLDDDLPFFQKVKRPCSHYVCYILLASISISRMRNTCEVHIIFPL